MDAQLIISIMVGLCLSAACGLKVFVPPLAAGLANQAGLLTLSENTQWLGSWPAITAFAIALAFEFVGFCIPVFGLLQFWEEERLRALFRRSWLQSAPERPSFPLGFPIF